MNAAAPAWSNAVHELWAQGGRVKVQSLDASAALLRALELGLCKRLRGRWEITPLGLAWCEGRVRAVRRQGLHFEATWLGGVACLSRKALQRAPAAPVAAVDPIRPGQLYRLPSGRYAIVEGVWGAVAVTCVYVPHVDRPERVCLRRDYFVVYAKRVPWLDPLAAGDGP